MGLRKDIKKLLVPNKVPAATSFKVDEIVINPIDGKAYIKKTDNTVIELGSGGDSAFTTEISASFSSSIAALETGGTGVQAASVSGAIDVATGSLLITASAFTTNTLQFTKGDTSTFNVVHTASLSQDLTTVLSSDVGAVSSGETFSAGSSIEALLRELLIDFINPTMNSLTIKDSSNASMVSRIEVGDSDIVTKGSFTTSSNSSTNGFDGGLSLGLSGNANSLGTVTSSSLNLDFPDLTLRRTSRGSVTFTLTGTFTGGSGGTSNKTDSVSFLSPYFFGASTISAIAGNINTNIDSILADISGSGTATGDVSFTSPTNTFGNQTYVNTTGTNLPSMTLTLPDGSADSSKFTYIIYPSDFGNLSNILQNGTDPVLGAFTQLSTDGSGCNHTRFSVATEYIVYRSNLPGAFSIGDTLVIDD